MKNILLPLLLSCFAISAFAQVQQNGLVGYFSFDNCAQIDSSNVYVSDAGGGVSVNIIRADGGPSNCVPNCGVQGNGFSLNGIDEQLVFFSGFSGVFKRDDFAISFYFRPEAGSTKMNLFMNAEDCSDNNRFTIDYNPAANQVEVELTQEVGISGNVSGKLDNNRCWQHVAFVREGRNSILYINGVQADINTASTRVDIDNSSTLVLGSNLCGDRFRGLIDEIAVYNEAITPFDVRDLFFNPEEIENRDTTIFIGGSVQINLSNNCANTYNWFPTDDVSDPNIANPILTPVEDIVYEVDMIGPNCTATDNITITVLDPDELDCNVVYFPNAFTPNGDNLNSIFRINNPYTIDALISFEILDRWGGRVFFTDDPFEGWDGSFDGQDVNPGVLLYRVKFVCDGNEKIQVGSLSLLR